MSDDRWAKDALLDHLGGGWASPYVRLLTDIKNEVGMFRWPQSKAHIDAALAGHFLMETNKEIQRLDLPALEPLAKRARMEHVNESLESQVIRPLCPLFFVTLLCNIIFQAYYISLTLSHYTP